VLALAAAVIVPMLLESEPRPLGEDVAVKIPPVDDGKFVNRLNDPATKGDRTTPPRTPESGDATKSSAVRAADAAKAPDAGKSSEAARPLDAAKASDAAKAKYDTRLPDKDPAAATTKTDGAGGQPGSAGAPAAPAATIPAVPSGGAMPPKAAPSTAPAATPGKAPAPVTSSPAAASSPAPATTTANAAPAASPATATTMAKAAPAASSLAAPSAATSSPGGSPPAAAATPAGANAGANGAFAVQLAAFSDDKGANALAGRLKRAGYAAYTEPVKTSKATLWRVRVGPYPSREAATAARDRLKAEGQSGIVAPAH